MKFDLALRFFDLEAHGVTLVNFVSHNLRDDVTIQSREEGRVSGRTISQHVRGCSGLPLQRDTGPRAVQRVPIGQVRPRESKDDGIYGGRGVLWACVRRDQA